VHAPSRLEPTIKHLVDTLQIALALLGRDGDVINVLPVEILDPGDSGQLF